MNPPLNCILFQYSGKKKYKSSLWKVEDCFNEKQRNLFYWKESNPNHFLDDNAMD